MRSHDPKSGRTADSAHSAEGERGRLRPSIDPLLSAISQAVFEADSTDDLFNFYRDADADLDVVDAPALRRENLRRYLEDHADGVRLLLVAEAPGPWGCRFSGVPITSEAQLVDPDFPAAGSRTSLQAEPLSEYSAGIFWRVLKPYYRGSFVWNAVPHHPHRPGEPLSIRTPRQSEIDRFLPILDEVVRRIHPESLVAVGRKAENALKRIGRDAEYVRHPSQGGALLFAEGVHTALATLGLFTDRP